jgi:methylated-DNA-[protein]-cysteine S-methyltransferase
VILLDEVTSTGVETPAGPVCVQMQAGAVTAIDWQSCPQSADTDLAREVTTQLGDYFAGHREAFDLPLAPKGSAFQRQFYDILCDIPFGQTREYGEIAREMGVPAQAIGQACGGNPIPILIPCHRVLGASGLGGFSAKGGVETKVMLLRLEGAASLLI